MRAFAIIKQNESVEYPRSGRGELRFNTSGYTNKSALISIESLPVVPVQRTNDSNRQLISNDTPSIDSNQLTYEKKNELCSINQYQAQKYSGNSRPRLKLFQNCEEKVKSCMVPIQGESFRKIESPTNTNSLHIPARREESILIEQFHNPKAYVPERLHENKTIRRKKIFCKEDKQVNSKISKQQTPSISQSNKNIRSIIKTSIVVATRDDDQFPKHKQSVCIPKSQGLALTIFQIMPISPIIF